jgi:HNH endonuclease
MPRGKRCIAHSHEYITAEEYHHVQPQARGGKTEKANMVYLCANAHSDVHYFLDLIEARAKKHLPHPEQVPGSIAVHYGPKVRQVARAGWAKYGDAFIAGHLDAHVLLWSSSGEPREDQPAVPPFWVAKRRTEAEHWLRMARVDLVERQAAADGEILL